VLVAAWQLGHLAATTRRWLEGEAQMDAISDALMAVPVASPEDQGGRDALTWILAGAATAARTDAAADDAVSGRAESTVQEISSPRQVQPRETVLEAYIGRDQWPPLPATMAMDRLIA